MNGAQYIVKALEAQGVSTLFGYPGGCIMPLYDALIDSPIEHILCRHEQAAALAADGYARASGQVGVCVATSGPGATNLVTGIANAYSDSIPLVAITGQVPTALIGTDAFQETDILGMTLGIVKHSYLVQQVETLPQIMAEAFALARSGRPGPVLIDIPKDVQLAELTAPAPSPQDTLSTPPKAASDALARARQVLRQSHRPLLYVGGGVMLGDAVDALRRFAAITGIPAVTTLKGIGALPGDDPHNLGMLGMHGAPGANRMVQACDLLLCVGARFDDRATGKLAEFAPQAQVIQLDIDAAEMGKLRTPTVALRGDLRHSLEYLAQPLAIESWRATCRQARQDGDFTLPPARDTIVPQRFLRALSQQATADTFISCDVGQHQMWVAQYYRFRHPRQHLSSSGLGTMGYGLPAAIGAQRAHPGATVINISGDGSFMMNLQELATLRRYRLPVKLVVLDNQYLGMVRQQQELFYAGRYKEVELSDNPDFVQVAHAFGIPALRVERADDMDGAIDTLLHSNGPLLLHLPIDREDNVWPIVPPGHANHRMLEECP